MVEGAAFLAEMVRDLLEECGCQVVGPALAREVAVAARHFASTG